MLQDAPPWIKSGEKLNIMSQRVNLKKHLSLIYGNKKLELAM